MIAIDTNVLVRLLVGDEPAQARRARRLVEKSDILVCTSVLLETEWVLRSADRFDPDAISAAFRGLLGLPNIVPESPAALAQALDGYDAGLDFADALHLASAHAASAFCTFDRRLLRAARGKHGPVKAVPE
jgi:predicted nucleic acid-binding protein